MQSFLTKLKDKIDDIRSEISYMREESYCNKMDKKYGSYLLETDDYKFIWGITSWDNLSGRDANIYTLNDIDIVYDKKEKVYFLGIETAYIFKSFESECKYLRDCLDAFGKYMDDNYLDKNTWLSLSENDTWGSMKAYSIEELYMNFKIFVDGYCCHKE